MPDMFDREKRSQVMSRIKSTRTKPELLFKRFLEEAGVPFEYQPKMFGRPDFLMNGKVAVFIDNRFWHGKGNIPLNNREYWEKKLERNRQRDVEVTKRLHEEGFRVVRIDDHEVLKMFKDFRILDGAHKQ
jgi:DNA mismatch endonuclease (patch repair protein)